MPKREEDMDRYKVEALSDEYEITYVVPVAPTRRDLWKILRGKYKPQVKEGKTLTWKGMNRVLKEVWTDPALIAQLRGPGLHGFLKDTVKSDPDSTIGGSR